MTKAITIIDEVAEILQDELKVTNTQLIRWLNDAQRAIVMARPDSNSIIFPFKCVAGTKQDLVIGDVRLLRVTRNLGVAGTTPGKAINIVERGILDRFDPDWHTKPAQTIVKEYMYDAVAKPHSFYVNPPIVTSPDVFIEIIKAIVPTVLVDKDNDDIELRDTYIPVIHEWMLYKSFARDSEETPNWQRSAKHFRNFHAMLGIKIEADIIVDPRLMEHLR